MDALLEAHLKCTCAHGRNVWRERGVAKMNGVDWFGLGAVALMVVSYALEGRAAIFVALFAAGCALAAIYALMIGSYPFFVAEGIWALVALRRWRVRQVGATDRRA